METKRIRLLVVDDSALCRKIITSSLAPFPEIEIVGTAMDPYIARDKILEANPDVITLDIEMPRMDGITFLKLIMKHRPMPVIIMSFLTAAGSEKALEALQAGAVDVMEKSGGPFPTYDDGARLAEKIKAAACARIARGPLETVVQNCPARAVRLAQTGLGRHALRKIILLGASTGGTEALKTVLTSMAGDLPGICIVQHIPACFSKAFANRMNEICPMEVREAKHGDAVVPGLALIAPGGYHMLVKWHGAGYAVQLNQEHPMHYQRPSVDILFDSAVKAGAGPHAVAALLTGMGSDGARGLLGLRQAGAATIAQNEETCVVFGMPREAIHLGAAQEVLSLQQIGPRLNQLVSASTAKRSDGSALSSNGSKEQEPTSGLRKRTSNQPVYE